MGASRARPRSAVNFRTNPMARRLNQMEERAGYQLIDPLYDVYGHEYGPLNTVEPEFSRVKLNTARVSRSGQIQGSLVRDRTSKAFNNGVFIPEVETKTEPSVYLMNDRVYRPYWINGIQRSLAPWCYNPSGCVQEGKRSINDGEFQVRWNPRAVKLTNKQKVGEISEKTREFDDPVLKFKRSKHYNRTTERLKMYERQFDLERI